METQHFICRTNAQGNLPPMPSLQPNRKVEVILRILEEDKTAKRQPRKPHPALAGKMVFKDDLMTPVVDETDWEVLK
jgi:hypothetical protein